MDTVVLVVVWVFTAYLVGLFIWALLGWYDKTIVPRWMDKLYASKQTYDPFA